MKIEITDNLFLKELELSDAAAMFAIIDSQREYLGRWLPFVSFTRQISDSEVFISSVVDVPENQKELVFSIYSGGLFAGLIGFKGTDRGNLRTEIGYWLGEQFQGYGIVTASVARLCDYAFGEAGMHRVQIKCAVGNTRSSNIPKRLGFRFEGIEKDGERDSDGTFRDIEVYSKLAGE